MLERNLPSFEIGRGVDLRCRGFMLGATAGFSGWLWAAGVTAPAAILLAGAVAVVIAGCVAASRRDIDGTTEVAALVVLAAGVLSGIGAIRIASGIIALLRAGDVRTLLTRYSDVALAALVVAIVAMMIVGAFDDADRSSVRTSGR